MSNIKRTLLVASLVAFSTGAYAQTATYIGGPKSGLTRNVNVGGAQAIGSDIGYSSNAQAAPARPRVAVPGSGVSGGVQAIGADSESYEPAVRLGVRAVPARRAGGSGVTSGAKAIGSDD